MEVTVERTGPCEATVSFTVPHAEFEGEVRRQLKAAGRNVRMKGFRPGKVPGHVLEKQFGQEARQRTLETFFNQAYERAVKEEELEAVGFERVRLEDVEIPEADDFSHKFEVSLRPEVELGEIKGLRIESELEPVLDQEVEAALEDLRRQRATPEAAGEEGLPEDGMAVVAITWKHGEETVLERDGLRISPLDPLPGVDPERFREAILGSKDGDTLELELVIPEDFEREDLRGAAGSCLVEVQEAFKMVPPSDEEIRGLFDVETDEDLQRIARERLAEAKESRERSRVETALLERVLDAHEVELPQRMVASQLENRLHSMKHQLEGQGLGEEEIEAELESQKDEIRGMVVKGVKAYFVVQAIATAEDVQVQNQDLVDELKAIAERNNTSYEEVRDYYREQGLVDQVAIELMERKVRAFLREHAEIAEPS